MNEGNGHKCPECKQDWSHTGCLTPYSNSYPGERCPTCVPYDYPDINGKQWWYVYDDDFTTYVMQQRRLNSETKTNA